MFDVHIPLDGVKAWRSHVKQSRYQLSSYSYAAYVAIATLVNSWLFLVETMLVIPCRQLVVVLFFRCSRSLVESSFSEVPTWECRSWRVPASPTLVLSRKEAHAMNPTLHQCWRGDLSGGWRLTSQVTTRAPQTPQILKLLELPTERDIHWLCPCNGLPLLVIGNSEKNHIKYNQQSIPSWKLVAYHWSLLTPIHPPLFDSLNRYHYPAILNHDKAWLATMSTMGNHGQPCTFMAHVTCWTNYPCHNCYHHLRLHSEVTCERVTCSRCVAWWRANG